MFIPTLNLILVKYVYSHLTFINIKFKVTDSSPPNDTIGPLYGYPVRLPSYSQVNMLILFWV